jgi:hypothetical protein
MGRFGNKLDLGILHDFKHKAMRSGLWFTVLRRIDRVLVDVTIRVAKSVYSATLAEALLSIIDKLENASRSRVWNVVHKTGFVLAHKLSALAQKWGNCCARDWALDKSFARYLAIMHINSMGMYRQKQF